MKISRYMSKWAAGLVVIALLLCLVAKALGGLQVPNPLLANFGVGCAGMARPCWQGIAPGLTRISAAREIVEALGYVPDNTNIELSDRVFVYRAAQLRPACLDLYYAPATGMVESVVLRCLSLRVGDIILGAGAPAQRWGKPALREALYYPDRLVAFLQYGQPHLSPHNMVEAVYVRAQENNLFNPAIAIGWHGFAPLWRYCQLEADYPLCAIQ
jgi:hypothetical protein